MSIAPVSLFFFLFLLVVPALTIWALIDLLSRPASDWHNSDQDKLVWVIVVVLVGVIGPILYLTIGRPKLNSPVPLTLRS